MTGWVTLAIIGAFAAALLAILRVPRSLWAFVLSFLLLGAAGYVRQGNPTLPAHSAVADAVKSPIDPAYKEMRDALFGRFGGESIYFGISDRQLGEGKTELASSVLIGAMRYAPQNAAFWTELGNALSLHDHGLMSPTALFAFRQAMRVAPEHPGPPFFLGWAYLRSGDPVAARAAWARSLALAPPKAAFRAPIAERLALLDSFLAGSPPPPR